MTEAFKHCVYIENSEKSMYIGKKIEKKKEFACTRGKGLLKIACTRGEGINKMHTN